MENHTNNKRKGDMGNVLKGGAGFGRHVWLTCGVLTFLREIVK